MYVVSGSVEWARAIIRVTLTLSLLSANTQVDIISFLLLVQKTFLEFLFNLEINQQWGSGTEMGGGTPFYGQKKMIKFV